MDYQLIGQGAALLTAILWTLNALLFTSAGKRIGAVSVNAVRIVAAVFFIGVVHVIVLRQLLPAATSGQWLWLALSGIVGLGIGDFGLFAAFVIIGPRRQLLIMTLAPLIASIGGYLMVGEELGRWAIFGISLTLIGVFIVLLERKPDPKYAQLDKQLKRRGLMYGFIGALGQGLGLVFAKYGMSAGFAGSDSINPISTTFIRLLAAGVFILIVVVMRGYLPEIKKSFNDHSALKFTLTGAFIGPFIGLLLLMYALKHVHTGIAATITSLMPVIVIPFVWIFYKEKTNLIGIGGAILAVIGVAVLFLA